MDCRELFESVCAVLIAAGLVIALPGAPGLYLRHCRRGVIVGWRTAADTLSAFRAAERAVRHPTDGTVTRELAALLREAGYQVTEFGEDLLVTTAPAVAGRCAGPLRVTAEAVVGRGNLREPLRT